MGAWGGEPARPKVGVLTDNYPFSFRGSNGEIAGFAYDVVREVERAMGLQFERATGPTPEINGAFAEGRLDLLQSYAHSPEREMRMDFSVPYLAMTGAIFVREGEQTIATLADLRGRKVAVHRGSLGEDVLRKAGLADSIMIVDSVEQSLVRLDRGEADATLAARLSGLALAHHQGLTRVRALPGAVAGYEVRYCIAVRKGDRQLLARVNEGLAVLVRTGKFDEIYQRWFGAMEPSKYTVEQVALGVAAGLTLALAVAIWAVVRQRTLRLRIARQAEELRLSEERHRAVFEGAHDGLIVLGPADGSGDFPVEQLNPAARRLLQVEPGGTAGLTLRRLLPDEVAVHGLVAAAVVQREVVTGEHECAGCQGWWRVSVGLLGNRTLLALADITEATETRARLHRQEELMRQKQKLEAIGTLAGGVAHDFNNLLTAIMGNTELCLMELPPMRPEVANLQRVMQAAKRAGQIVKQILTFSRRSEPSREVVAVSAIMEETVSFLRSVARGNVEFVHVKATAPLPGIVADAAQVHQVLMNVGTNAVQAMQGRRGTLTLTEEEVVVGEEVQSQHPKLKPGHYVRLGFRDTGPGMTEHVKERIFEPFFTTKAAGEGTGLGLSVVHGIVEQHGGGVTVYSQPGRGTLFHVYFPVVTDGATAASSEDAERVPVGQGERVLFVDDEPMIAKTAEEVLRRLGYRPSVHTQPESALAELAAADSEFAIMVSDLTMPGCSGLELAARVQALRPELPFILTSGFFSGPEKQAAEALGIARCIQKPITYAALGRAVGKCLGKDTVSPFGARAR